MNRILLGLGLIILVALFSTLYLAKDYLNLGAVDMSVLVILASFAVTFGFLLAIKFMSEL
jgi:hypothetical protein